MPIMEFKDRLREAIKKAGIKQKALSNKMEVSTTTIQHWLIGRNKPSRDKIKKLAGELKVTPEWLEFGSPVESSGPSPKDSPITSTVVHDKSSLKTIPVVGTTQGGPDRHWEDLGFPPGWGTEYAVIECDDPHAYILRVEGDSMSPRINEGDYVLVEPSTLAQPGDIIVTRLQSGEVMLKYFRADYGEEVALESHNHGFTLRTVPKADIVFMHSISGILFRRKIKKRI